MAASYWHSTQRQYWTFTKQSLADRRKKLEDAERHLIQQYPLPDRRLLSIYFYNQMQKLVRTITVRQQALATAQVYIRRFYTKVEIRRTSPMLVVATAVYMACKMEECPQHIRIISAEARNHLQADSGSFETAKIGECEFSIISEMNSQLIVHHPYRSLADLQQAFPLTSEEHNLAWSAINDHYFTDLPLLYPPHVIAITAIFLAVALRPTQVGLQSHSTTAANALQALGNARAGAQPQPPSGQQSRVQKLVNWIADSAVEIEAIVDCTQELISLYEVWEQYNDKTCRDAIARLVKGRSLDK